MMAACLLLFACMDVFCPPSSCCSGVEGLEGYALSLSGNNAQDSTQKTSFDKSEGVPRDNHSDCSTCDEACFCCGHAMVNTANALASIPGQSLTLISFAINPIPNPPLRGTYHPPRLA